MLSQMSPADFEERYRLYQIDPSPNSCEALCLVLAAIENGFASLRLGRVLTKDERVKLRDMMPKFEFEKINPRRAMQSVDEIENWAAKRYG